MSPNQKRCNGPICQGGMRAITAFRVTDQGTPRKRGPHAYCRDCEAHLARDRMARLRARKREKQGERTSDLTHARTRAKTRLVTMVPELFRTIYTQELVAVGIAEDEARAIAEAYSPRGGRPKLNGR